MSWAQADRYVSRTGTRRSAGVGWGPGKGLPGRAVSEGSDLAGGKD